MPDSNLTMKYCPQCLEIYWCSNTCTNCKTGLFKHQRLIEVAPHKKEDEYFEEIRDIDERYNNLSRCERNFIWLYENKLKDSSDYDNSNFESDRKRFRQMDLDREFRIKEKQLTAIHCPNCNSTNTEKISTTKKVASTAVLGLASSTIGKNYKCKNCGYIW